jgi:hypothetical protein
MEPKKNKGELLYNAASGVGITVGSKSGLILHAEVKNKRCTICDAAKNKNEQPNGHECYLNWTEGAGAYA